MNVKGKLSFLGERFPNLPKNRLKVIFMGLCPKPHLLFEKSKPKTFICLRRFRTMYMVLQMRVQGNHFPGRVWDSVPRKKENPRNFPGVIFIGFLRIKHELRPELLFHR